MSYILRKLTGSNLEVFRFGMYIMFPIGTMYYFGTNLDSRFAVPDFWPKEGETHTIPFEKEDIQAELERLKQRRLAARARRLELQAQGVDTEVTRNREEEEQKPTSEMEMLNKVEVVEPERSQVARDGGGKGWFGGWLR